MMTIRTTCAALATVISLIAIPGCAVMRDQSTVGEYVDDSKITTEVKAKFVENKAVDASSISVETLQGTVLLSGFAKSSDEKMTAESIARNVKGVKMVKNSLVVRSAS